MQTSRSRLSPASREIFDRLMRAHPDEAQRTLGLPGSGSVMSDDVRTMLRELKSGVVA